ncbi:MAG: DsrE family protein [Candidatus Zapsychrus exili]|nr:DsrE family protein [Candidatus Zapsychrus exili]
MKIGVVISSNDVETSWNALRYANFCLSQKDEVKIFFMGKGVEYQKISTDKFNTVQQAEKFMKDGGAILACGSCIKSREQEESEIRASTQSGPEDALIPVRATRNIAETEMCPISTMKDMYDITKESDKLVTF